MYNRTLSFVPNTTMSYGSANAINFANIDSNVLYTWWIFATSPIVFAPFCVRDSKFKLWPKSTPPSSLRYRTVVAWGAILGLLSVERAYVHDGMFFDHFLATAIIFTYAQLRIPQPVSKVLSFIGKHSMNIFLFHTFIFGLWFSSFIYSTRNPLIIFMLLLVICVLISVVIEMIKKIVGFNRVQGKLLNLYVRQ